MDLENRRDLQLSSQIKSFTQRTLSKHKEYKQNNYKVTIERNREASPNRTKKLMNLLAEEKVVFLNHVEATERLM